MRTTITIIRASLVLVAAGVGLLIFIDGVAGRATAIALLGIGGVLLVAAAFLAVGNSEDRARESEAGTAGPRDGA